MDWHFSYWIWIGIEVLVLVCLLFLYHRIMKPFQLLENGMLLLKEQDFSSRLRKVGQKDADSIIQIFNRMMEQLKYERLHVREQDQLFDLIFYSSPMGIVIMDLDERIQSMNPSAERLLGISFAELTKCIAKAVATRTASTTTAITVFFFIQSHSYNKVTVIGTAASRVYFHLKAEAPFATCMYRSNLIACCQ